MKNYLQQKGFFNFEKFQSSIATFTRAFNESTFSEVQNGEIKINHVDKFEIQEEHDFKQWEHYDIVKPKNKD